MNKFYPEKIFSKNMVSDTLRYGNIYGFNTDKNSTHNNEADAFKHAYMQAYLTILGGKHLAKYLGDRHENQGNFRGQPIGENNMDKWNNQQGREIAREIIQEYGPLGNLPFTRQLSDRIAEKVMQRLKSGQLIINPSDSRKFKDITGYATNIDDFERIFTAEEIGNMSKDDFIKYEPEIDKQINFYGIPRKLQAEKAVQSGDLIWVEGYVRSDGTHVSGYFRHK